RRHTRSTRDWSSDVCSSDLAFVRSPESVTLKNERLTVLKGNVMDENQLFDTMQNHDAVLSALGPREVFKPSSLLHDSALATTRRSEERRVGKESRIRQYKCT